MQLCMEELKQNLLKADLATKDDDMNLLLHVICECHIAEDIKDLTLDDISRLLENAEDIVCRLDEISNSITEFPGLLRMAKRVPTHRRLL